jgi:hypothetical protein
MARWRGQRADNGVAIACGGPHKGESTAVIDVPRTPIGMHPDRHASRAQHISIFIDSPPYGGSCPLNGWL